MAAEKKAPDWERIEHDYRAGILSLREIAKDAGITEGAVRKRAKRDGWERDLAAKIQAKADALVRKAEVRGQYAAATERDIIEANAERIAQVRGEHRADITRMRALVLRLLAECEAEAGDPALFAELGDILRSADENGTDRLNDAYHKAIALPTRIKSVKELADTLKTLVALEREAYDIAPSTGSQPADGVTVTFNDNELARRIAFTLAKGLKPQE
jgi:hypothetical protein